MLYDVLLSLFLDPLPFFYLLLLVNFAPLLHYAGVLIIDIDVYDIELVERTSPSLRNAVLYFVFQLVPTWALCQSLCD